MGPLLQTQFESTLRQKGFIVHDSAPEAEESSSSANMMSARVGLISHVGGHKFAGNVIIYVPPTFPDAAGTGLSALAGKGIWYGRVEPRHVEGIVSETVVGGRVVEELFRGGIGQDGRILRLRL